MKRRWLCIVPLLLSACVANDRHFRRPVIDINGDILGRYWVVTQHQTIFEVPEAPRIDCGAGQVTLRYLIDSHGHVYESEILHAEPEGCYEAAALRLLQSWSFVPTAFNREKIPVRVTQRIPFSSD